jgi:cytochrome P450
VPIRALTTELGRTPISRGLLPRGPDEDHWNSDDLLDWMGVQFNRYGDTFRASVCGTTVYATRNLEFAYHVLVGNWHNYVKGQFIKRVAFLLGNGLMVSEGELWKRQRRMIQPAFHPQSIAPLAQMIIAVNAALLEKWQSAARNGASVNVTRDVSAMALEVILRSIFGLDYDDYEAIGCHFNLVSEEPARDFAFAQAFRGLRKLILQVVDRRRRERATAHGDFLSLLMHARDPHDGASMPDRQIVNEVLTLIVAGHETTASTLNWTWYLLSQHPEVEAQLGRELAHLTGLPDLDDLTRFPYSRQIIDESMRLYPPGWLLTRKALHDDHLGDYFVPAGTEVYIAPYFIQRHPAIWPDPDCFDPGRFDPDRAHDRHRLATIPFSSGPRNCIGERLARLEMQLHLLIIARQMRLRYVQSKPLELDAGVNLRSKYDFIMSPILKPANH